MEENKAAKPVIKRRGSFLVVAISITLLVAALFNSMRDTRKPSISSDAQELSSTSAIGYKAFIQCLSQSELRIQYKTMNELGPGDMDSSLVIYFFTKAELLENSQEVTAIPLSHKGILFVLPKWIGDYDDKTGNLKKVHLVNPAKIDSVLNVKFNISYIKTSSVDAVWSNVSPGNAGFQVYAPQTITSDSLSSMTGSRQTNFWSAYKQDSLSLNILSDPDIISNYGFRIGQNSAKVMRILYSLLPAGSKKVIISMESFGGLKKENLFNALFRFPINMLTFFFLLVCILLIWSGNWKRMQLSWVSNNEKGKKDFLLLAFANKIQLGHISNRNIAEKYIRLKIRECRNKLFAPPNLTDQDLLAWFNKFTKIPGTKTFQDHLNQVNVGKPELSDNQLYELTNEVFQLTNNILKHEP